MNAHGSLQRYWSSSRSCHDVIFSGLFLVSERRSSFVFWKKIVKSYTANRRVTDVKYFHNYTNTYPIVPRLLVLSLLRPHTHRVQTCQRANFFSHIWPRHGVGPVPQRTTNRKCYNKALY
jgi:hypothetical protein